MKNSNQLVVEKDRNTLFSDTTKYLQAKIAASRTFCWVRWNFHCLSFFNGACVYLNLDKIQGKHDATAGIWSTSDDASICLKSFFDDEYSAKNFNLLLDTVHIIQITRNSQLNIWSKTIFKHCDDDMRWAGFNNSFSFAAVKTLKSVKLFFEKCEKGKKNPLVELAQKEAKKKRL